MDLDRGRCPFFRAGEIFTVTLVSTVVNSTQKESSMQSNLQKVTIAVSVCAAILVAASVYRVTAYKRIAQQQHKQIEYVTDKLPPIEHKVAGVRIVKAILEKPGTPDARVVLKFRNYTDVAVTDFTITAGDISVGPDGGLDNDVPETVLEPRGTRTLELPASNFEKDAPIVLAAVVYADGNEEGEDIVLEMIHNRRADAKAERDKQKGESPQ